MQELFRESHLHALKGIGHHMLHKAREDGGDTSKPMAFIGLATIGIGVIMLLKAQKQMAERGR